MSGLFSELKLRNITLKNRIALSAMCQYSSVDGHVNDWQLVHLGSKAAGGAGLIITEATAVSPEGRISPWDAGLWKDSQIEPWKRIFDFIKAQGAVAGIQLAHAGRKGSADYPWKGGTSLSEKDLGWETLAPTSEAFGRHLNKVPREMTVQEIKDLVKSFGTAAYRASIAGAQLIEIHAGHGYLLHEFLSPLVNKRTDEYGGNFENRTRILIEIVREIRSLWPQDLPVITRLSTTDWDDSGWGIEDSIRLAKILSNLGIDLIDASSGFVAPAAAPYPVSPGWQVELAARIKQEVKIPTGAVGMILSGIQAEEILRDQKADLIFIAREFLRQPHWPMMAAKELNFDLTKVGAIQISHWIK